jgi:hypothetical protein
MAYMLPGPDAIQTEFVVPHIKRGDWYLFRNRVNGRSMYVFPRMMNLKTYPVVMPMGDEPVATATSITDWMTSLLDQPQQLYQQVQDTRAELVQARQIMTISIVASLLASGLVVWMAFRRN